MIPSVNKVNIAKEHKHNIRLLGTLESLGKMGKFKEKIARIKTGNLSKKTRNVSYRRKVSG